MTVDEFIRELKQRVAKTESMDPFSHEELDGLRDVGIFVRRHKGLLDFCVPKTMGTIFGQPLVIDDSLNMPDMPVFGGKGKGPFNQ